jgi:hypothetical protein
VAKLPRNFGKTSPVNLLGNSKRKVRAFWVWLIFTEGEGGIMKPIKWLLAALLILALTQGAAGAQSLMVKMPNGGENYPLNETRPITWNSDKVNGNVVILLINKKTNESFTIEGAYNSKPEWPYNWKVGKVTGGKQVPPGNDYVIRIQTIDGKVVDESDKTFSISTTMKIKITNPTGLNVWSLKSQRLITWENPGNLSGNVKLVLKPKGSGAAVMIKENLPVGNLKYSWVVGDNQNGVQVAPGKYSIIIMTMDTQYADATDWFSITGPGSYSLIPEIYNFWWYSYYRWRNPVCGASLDSKGLAPEESAAASMRVGFENSYDKKFCEKRYVGHAFRGFLKFDLSQVKGKLVKAKLLLTRKSTKRSEGNSASNAGSCAGSISIMDEPISGFSAKAHLYDKIPQSKGTTANVKYDGAKNIEIDVTSVVQEWLDGKKPNYGFMFIGPNESYNRNNDCCVTIYNPIVLSIEMQSFL